MDHKLNLLLLKNTPILDQLKIEEALLRLNNENWCIINEGYPPSIVMGISGKPEELVNIKKVEKNPIPLIKRYSGGGTVIVDANTLFVSLIFQKEIHDFPCFPEPILRWSENFYKKGMDEIQFLFKANKGYDFKKIKEAASGGEMSRIMLAIKSIMANYNQLPSIIFDEIDTGVSGEISKKMGIIMKNLGSKLQTFSITHLPQIAAMGESHFKIYKSDEEGITKTMMLKLNENDRIVEIAKMLEGNNASESAFIHAKQLLN